MENNLYEEYWQIYLFDVYKVYSSVMVDIGFLSTAPVENFTSLFSVKIKMKSPKEDGWVSSEETGVLFELENKLADALLNSGKALYVTRIIASGYYTLYFYTSNDYDATSNVNEVMKNYDEYFFTTNTIDDKYWQEYLTVFNPSKSQIDNANLRDSFSKSLSEVQESFFATNYTINGVLENPMNFRTELEQCNLVVTETSATKFNITSKLIGNKNTKEEIKKEEVLIKSIVEKHGGVVYEKSISFL